MFKEKIVSILVLHLFTLCAACLATPLKPRIVVLTDISPDNVEPDDMESIIRLFTHADMYEIECLIHSTGWSVWGDAGQTGLNLINEAIDLYEKDLPNLMKRSDQKGHLHDDEHQKIGYWPSADYLRERVMLGSKNRGSKFIGSNNNSDGSCSIITLADEPDDERPLWVTVWGGGNTLAQAIWQVQQDRTDAELKNFLYKLRVYTITDQDAAQKKGNVVNWPESSHQWMRKEFEEDLFFIWDESAWGYQNGTGRSRWNEYQTHIQGHGNLGNRYPKYKYGVEGDTPAFLHLMPTGLNNPNFPNQVGWGGYFEFGNCKDNATRAYQNHSGNARNISSKYQQYFYQATFNNFAARMDWAKDGAGNRNPVIVIDGDDGIAIITKRPQEGSTITLDASDTFDPDDDKLTFKWWVLSEAGTYTDDVNISNSSSSIATIDIPSDSGGKSFHVICEVIDDGTHNLSDYRRIIFKPTGNDTVSMNLPFRQWLYEYIPTQYPEAKMTDHTSWLQSYITEDLVVNWTEWTDEDSTLKAMEAHNLTQGKAMFIEQKGQKKDWADHPAVTYYEGAGYYISGYDPATMGSWDGKGLSVIQFDGNAKEFSDTMAKAWAKALPTLVDVFKDAFLIGGAYNHDLVAGRDPKAAAIAAKHNNTATSENDMKWANIHPRPGQYNWGPADDFMAFCEKHQIVPIGHTLVWKSQVPGWVFSDENGQRMTREPLLARMEEHIHQVVGRYKGRIKGWDVVNEALNEDGTMRRDNWWGIISEGKESQHFDHIEYAFRYAHAADPEAELYYNDYNLDTKRAKCDGAIAIVKHLQSKGVRIDGVGIQLHAGLAGETYPNPDDLEYAINSISALGVKVMVTELDIKTKRSGYRGADVGQMNRYATHDADAESAETQKLLAEKYAQLFSIFLKYKKDITRVTFWGVHDGMSWISGSPLLFDKDYQPKEAFFAVLKTGLEH